MYVLTGFGIASPEPSNLFLRRRFIRHEPRLLIPFSAADRRIATTGHARRALLVSYCFVAESRGRANVSKSQSSWSKAWTIGDGLMGRMRGSIAELLGLGEATSKQPVPFS